MGYGVEIWGWKEREDRKDGGKKPEVNIRSGPEDQVT